MSLSVLLASEKILLNVEGLNGARTMLGKRASRHVGSAGEKSEFFSILLASIAQLEQ
jgi:hypothetical protein